MTVIQDPTTGKMSKEELGAGDDRSNSKFAPSSCVTVRLDSIRFPLTHADYYTRDDGTSAFVVNLTLECVADADGVNEKGAKHDEAFFVEAEEDGSIDTERDNNGKRRQKTWNSIRIK